MADFNRFYAVYPRKVARLDAEKAWMQMTRQYDPADIIRGAEKFARLMASEGKEQQFIPYPASWLRAGRWMDGELQETIVPRPEDSPVRKVQSLDELKYVLAARNGGSIPSNLQLDLKRAQSLEDLPTWLRNTMVPKDNVVHMKAVKP